MSVTYEVSTDWIDATCYAVWRAITHSDKQVQRTHVATYGLEDEAAAVAALLNAMRYAEVSAGE